MNPDTTLSEQDIKNICTHNNIAYRDSVRITTGFTNEVYLINGDTILKVCTRSENLNRFKVESKILKYKTSFTKPKFIADDFSNNIIPKPYILMGYVKGQALGSIWHNLNDSTRENLIRIIAANLKVINAIEANLIFDTEKKWGDDLSTNFTKKAPQLLERGTLSKKQIEDVQSILEKYKPLLNSTDTKVVFWDIHFDNFIVNDNNELAAIIDLEAINLTTLDYPLFILQKMAEDPKLYLSHDNEKHADKDDYKSLIDWYKRYYPEMFDFEHLEERVMIYRLLDAIHLLKDWSHVDSLRKNLEYFISSLK